MIDYSEMSTPELKLLRDKIVNELQEREYQREAKFAQFIHDIQEEGYEIYYEGCPFKIEDISFRPNLK